MGAHYVPRTPMPRPLIVRLRNWVGDVTLCVPALTRLADAGFDLVLVGKGWARDLLAGHGWPVHALPGHWRERVALFKRLRDEAAAQDPGFKLRLNALCYPDSFSSALEFRLAGLHALGHRWEARSALLAQAAPRQRGIHELEVYWQLTAQLLGTPAPLPTAIGLKLAPRHESEAEALRAQHGLPRDVVVICPFAGGTWAQKDKTWPGFAAFAAEDLPRLGRPVVVVPGPGEEAMAEQHFAGARCLRGVGLGAYAALLRDAALMLSNDTGPGHIAAAVGTPLVSVLGPSDASLWRAWGPRVRIVQDPTQADGWPPSSAVLSACQAALAR
jgi:heptosyltransferase II